MRIILAQPRGFCAGVKMAIESLRRALDQFGSPLYVYHEIVHNTWIVSHFRERGVVFVDHIDEVPEGACLMFSAHGVSPEVRELAAQRKLHTIDATCPLVTKVHREAIQFAADGCNVVLIGHAGHDEVVGTMGEVPASQIHLIGNTADVEDLTIPEDAKVAYLTQTTLSATEADATINALCARYPQAIGPPKGDICYATQHRQEAIRSLAREADVVLVIGSSNSSNSRRLAELATEQGTRAYLVDGHNDIDLENWFEPTDVVLVTAGASAPESIVKLCIHRLCERFDTTVETRGAQEREMRFTLPKGLRSET